MKKQISLLSAITAVTGLCLVLSFTANAQWGINGNSNIASTNFLGTTATGTFKDLIVKTNNVERMRILSGGNVGIGTTTPGYPLDVAGSVRVQSSTPTIRFGLTNDNFQPALYGYTTSFATDNISFAMNDVGGTKNTIGYAAARIRLFTSTSATGQNISFETMTPSTTSYNTRMMIQNDGKVGIGTTSPTSKLHLQDIAINTVALTFSSSFNGGSIRYTGTDATNANQRLSLTMGGGTELFTLLNDGNVGIGTTSPGSLLEINKSQTANTSVTIRNDSYAKGAFQITGNDDGGYLRTAYSLSTNATNYSNTWGTGFAVNVTSDVISGNNSPNKSNFIWTTTTNAGVITELMRLQSNGNVLIGKTTQTNAAYKLDVNGPIRANEVVVNTTGADFVFEENYELRKLEEVEKFIKENKHLPEIAPAKEMNSNGVEIGKLNTQLLQKVEEITLYMIEMNKEIQNLKAENEKLKASVKK